MLLGYYWGGAFHGILGLLVLVAFVALIAAAILFVARAFGAPGPRPSTQPWPVGPQPPAPTQPSAREILDRRLASGEISPEQYDEIRAKLAAR